MKEFIVRHPFITFLIVDTVCVTIQNCVAFCVAFTSETPKSHSITHQVVKGTVEAMHEAFPPKEG